MNRYRHADVTSAIGDTPIVRLHKVAASVASAIYVKLEFTNPGGSIKDRVGVYMCRKAAENGELPAGRAIVEGTSGNTGIGVALYANVHDHPCVFVMADKQSADKVATLKASGARVVLCPSHVARDDPRSYHSMACAIARRLDALHLDQHANPHNAESHYAQTGPEILRQTDGAFDVFVAAVGTGGTISGAGRFLKEHMPRLRVIGVDCEGSVLAHRHRHGDGGEWAPYLLEGIGDSYVPENLDLGVIDDFEVIGDEASFRMARAVRRGRHLRRRFRRRRRGGRASLRRAARRRATHPGDPAGLRQPLRLAPVRRRLDDAPGLSRRPAPRRVRPTNPRSHRRRRKTRVTHLPSAAAAPAADDPGAFRLKVSCT
jgi:cysteine synthase